jgi:hypothetical protein
MFRIAKGSATGVLKVCRLKAKGDVPSGPGAASAFKPFTKRCERTSGATWTNGIRRSLYKNGARTAGPLFLSEWIQAICASGRAFGLVRSRSLRNYLIPRLPQSTCCWRGHPSVQVCNLTRRSAKRSRSCLRSG